MKRAIFRIRVTRKASSASCCKELARLGGLKSARFARTEPREAKPQRFVLLGDGALAAAHDLWTPLCCGRMTIYCSFEESLACGGHSQGHLHLRQKSAICTLPQTSYTADACATQAHVCPPSQPVYGTAAARPSSEQDRGRGCMAPGGHAAGLPGCRGLVPGATAQLWPAAGNVLRLAGSLRRGGELRVRQSAAHSQLSLLPARKP